MICGGHVITIQFGKVRRAPIFSTCTTIAESTANSSNVGHRWHPWTDRRYIMCVNINMGVLYWSTSASGGNYFATDERCQTVLKELAGNNWAVCYDSIFVCEIGKVNMLMIT